MITTFKIPKQAIHAVNVLGLPQTPAAYETLIALPLAQGCASAPPLAPRMSAAEFDSRLEQIELSAEREADGTCAEISLCRCQNDPGSSGDCDWVLEQEELRRKRAVALRIRYGRYNPDGSRLSK